MSLRRSPDAEYQFWSDNRERRVAPISAIVRKTYLVTYDICHEKRLPKVHKIMRAFGEHLQYLVRCRHLLGQVIDHREDQVLFVDLGPTDGRGDRVITALGKPYAPIDAPCIIVDGELLED